MNGIVQGPGPPGLSYYNLNLNLDLSLNLNLNLPPSSLPAAKLLIGHGAIERFLTFTSAGSSFHRSSAIGGVLR